MEMKLKSYIIFLYIGSVMLVNIDVFMGFVLVVLVVFILLVLFNEHTDENIFLQYNEINKALINGLIQNGWSGHGIVKTILL